MRGDISETGGRMTIWNFEYLKQYINICGFYHNFKLKIVNYKIVDHADLCIFYIKNLHPNTNQRGLQ